MTKDNFIQQAIEIIKSTDAGGYPLAAHTKIARLRILLEKYENEQKKTIKKRLYYAKNNHKHITIIFIRYTIFTTTIYC